MQSNSDDASDSDGASSRDRGRSDRKRKSRSSKPRPKNCPPGTKPIDKAGLPKGQPDIIKGNAGQGPRDWTGITPDGDVIVEGENGQAENIGPVDIYLP